ncbi:putative integral membrane protein [Babesia bovis T2Bo]|uniref:putative integral membrane protein n=1 Tax=Babesia bovis T2Bo TaxID=484906 RepID=UPI001C365E7E|nr:putative integral membrane protein [Babesia bovis T2Bo]KAG6440062.1 putative integral membrane protein [Babesia bovis T2Bo]
MLVCPLLVVALGALWPLDWTHTRLDSLSPVTGHYHGSSWVMAEKVAQGDDPGEEVVVVEGTTSDEVAKNKESPKGWKEWCKDRCRDWAILGVVLVIALVAGFVVAAKSGWWAGLIAIVIVLVSITAVAIIQNWSYIKDKCISQRSGKSLKGMTAKNVD